MTRKHSHSTGALWVRFWFSVVGLLLSSPPARGALGHVVCVLAEKIWSHPVARCDFHVVTSTIAR
jgi:putative transposase